MNVKCYGCNLSNPCCGSVDLQLNLRICELRSEFDFFFFFCDIIQLIHLCIPTVPPRWCDPLVLRADCDFTLDHISISSEIHEWKCRVASAATGRSLQYTAACRFHGLPAGTKSREVLPVSRFIARFHSVCYVKAEAGQGLVLSHGLVSGCCGWFCLALSVSQSLAQHSVH